MNRNIADWFVKVIAPSILFGCVMLAFATPVPTARWILLSVQIIDLYLWLFIAKKYNYFN